MTKTQAIRHFKGVSALAAALSITYQAVHRWPERVPPYRQLQLERLTAGELKADPSAAGATADREAIVTPVSLARHGGDSAVQASSAPVSTV